MCAAQYFPHLSCGRETASGLCINLRLSGWHYIDKLCNTVCNLTHRSCLEGLYFGISNEFHTFFCRLCWLPWRALWHYWHLVTSPPPPFLLRQKPSSFSQKQNFSEITMNSTIFHVWLYIHFWIAEIIEPCLFLWQIHRNIHQFHILRLWNKTHFQLSSCSSLFPRSVPHFPVILHFILSLKAFRPEKYLKFPTYIVNRLVYQ